MKNRLIPCLVILAVIVLIVVPCAVESRVGGGESYGGGGSSGGWSGGGGGGGDDGTGELIMWLIYLIIECPAIGIPLTIIIIVIALYSKAKNMNMGHVTYSSRTDPSTRMRQVTISEKLKMLKETDPNFSRPLFLDFLQLFFTRVHKARGEHNWESVRPLIDPNLCAAFISESKSLSKVDHVIVGSARIVDINLNFMGMQRVTVEFEANFTEYADGHTKKELYSKEQWSWQRKSGVLSKGPDSISSFACPSCGSPAELRSDGSCPYCDKIVNRGDFHWQLYNTSILTRGLKPPIRLSLGGAEAGTDLPTVFQPGFEAARRNFQMRYPDFLWQEFDRRVRQLFLTLQQAWTKKQWELARPIESDYLFSTHRYWMEQYKAEGLTNVLEEIEISALIPVKIEQDAYFESITVRISARMKDYTVDENNKVVGGNKGGKRSFSEYWTFIRKAGFGRDEERDEKNCPNCGAPLNINMAGICEYCDSKLTTGDFNWVLSLIEQDEAYEG